MKSTSSTRTYATLASAFLQGFARSTPAVDFSPRECGVVELRGDQAAVAVTPCRLLALIACLEETERAEDALLTSTR